MKVTIDSKAFDASFRKMKEGLGQVLVNTSHEIGLATESKIKEEWPVSSGESGRQISTKTVKKGTRIITTVGTDVKTPWAIIIEEGRKPNNSFPNLGGISKFIARTPSLQKGLQAMVVDNGGKRPKNILVSQEYESLTSAQKGMVFVVARSIAKKGIEGRHIFEKVKGKDMPMLTEKILNRNLTKYLQKFQ